MQVIGNYETLSSVEKLAILTASYLRSKHVYGLIEHETPVTALGPTPQNDAPTLRSQENG